MVENNKKRPAELPELQHNMGDKAEEPTIPGPSEGSMPTKKMLTNEELGKMMQNA